MYVRVCVCACVLGGGLGELSRENVWGSGKSDGPGLASAHLGRRSGRQPAAVACQPCAADPGDSRALWRASLHLPGPGRARTSQAPAVALRCCRCHCGDPSAAVGIRRRGGRGSVDDAVRSRHGAPAARPRARAAPCQATGWYVLAAELRLPASAHPPPCSPHRLRGPRSPQRQSSVCTRRGRVAAVERRARPLLPAPQARAPIDHDRRGACRPHNLPPPHLLHPGAVRPAARASAAAARARAK